MIYYKIDKNIFYSYDKNIKQNSKFSITKLKLRLTIPNIVAFRLTPYLHVDDPDVSARPNYIKFIINMALYLKRKRYDSS